MTADAHRNAFLVSSDDHFPQPWDEVGVLLVPVGREALPHSLVAAGAFVSSVRSSVQSSPCGLLEDLDDLVGRDKEGILGQFRSSPERGGRRCWRCWSCCFWQRRSYGRVCHRGRRKIRSTRVEVQTTPSRDGAERRGAGVSLGLRLSPPLFELPAHAIKSETLLHEYSEDRDIARATSRCAS